MPSGELSEGARGAIQSLLTHFDPLPCFGCGAMEGEGEAVGFRATCPGCGKALFSCNACEKSDTERGYSSLYCQVDVHFKGLPTVDAAS